MSDRSAIKRFLGAAATALLIGLLVMPAAQAKDLPIYVEYTGTGHDLVPPMLGDPLPDNIVTGDAKGSFGARSTTIVSKFSLVPPSGENPCAAGFFYLGVAYARAVVTFQDGSQLFGTLIPEGGSYMCLDMTPGNETDGEFVGHVVGVFIGGTGRFEGASGTFVAPFVGKNLTSSMFGEFPFRWISGAFDGTVTFD